ncbi:hypothetical protein KFU94_53975 [Chloroflexi bacterium TSY]|nr:hypothetical protein [Chloroflexi bacterium TSY]
MITLLYPFRNTVDGKNIFIEHQIDAGHNHYAIKISTPTGIDYVRLSPTYIPSQQSSVSPLIEARQDEAFLENDTTNKFREHEPSANLVMIRTDQSGKIKTKFEWYSDNSTRIPPNRKTVSDAH